MTETTTREGSDADFSIDELLEAIERRLAFDADSQRQLEEGLLEEGDVRHSLTTEEVDELIASITNKEKGNV
jgi:hypothetical protein